MSSFMPIYTLFFVTLHSAIDIYSILIQYLNLKLL